MTVNYFTLYMLDGDRRIIKGETIEQAFTMAGYGAGAIAALDWFDNGITDTHYREGGVWIKRKPVKFVKDVFDGSVTVENVARLTKVFEKAHLIEIEYPNKDILYIEMCDSVYIVGPVRVIEISYAEYSDYPYYDESPHQHHFIVTKTEEHDPNKQDKAVLAFLKRFNQNPVDASGCETVDLEELSKQQAI